MSTIAILTFFIAYIIAPASPITWLLLALTFAALAWDALQIRRAHKAAK